MYSTMSTKIWFLSADSMTVDVGCGGGANDEMAVLWLRCREESVCEAMRSAVSSRFQISDKWSNVG